MVDQSNANQEHLSQQPSAAAKDGSAPQGAAQTESQHSSNQQSSNPLSATQQPSGPQASGQQPTVSQQPPAQQSAPAAPTTPELISIDEFAKVQLLVGQILTAEKLEKSEKLLKLTVDLGEPKGPRQILSGIAKHYSPESLPGRKIVVVANLKPAKLMGQLSEGMLLAACDEAAGTLELVSPGAALPVGSTVR